MNSICETIMLNVITSATSRRLPLANKNNITYSLLMANVTNNATICMHSFAQLWAERVHSLTPALSWKSSFSLRSHHILNTLTQMSFMFILRSPASKEKGNLQSSNESFQWLKWQLPEYIYFSDESLANYCH